jgi:hypothetical protein
MYLKDPRGKGLFLTVALLGAADPGRGGAWRKVLRPLGVCSGRDCGTGTPSSSSFLFPDHKVSIFLPATYSHQGEMPQAQSAKTKPVIDLQTKTSETRTRVVVHTYLRRQR